MTIDHDKNMNLVGGVAGMSVSVCDFFFKNGDFFTQRLTD